MNFKKNLFWHLENLNCLILLIKKNNFENLSNIEIRLSYFSQIILNNFELIERINILKSDTKENLKSVLALKELDSKLSELTKEELAKSLENLEQTKGSFKVEKIVYKKIKSILILEF